MGYREVVLYQTDFQLQETESCKDGCAQRGARDKAVCVCACVKVIHVQ